MNREEANQFAHEWAAAWNRRDVEKVLEHFSEGVIFTSPTAFKIVGAATVRGKPALREYWNQALAQIRSLQFSVERVLWDDVTRELAIIYTAVMDGRSTRVSENLIFGSDGQVVSAEVFHG
jgi:ketosteroid isomerase-like protein